jgi:Ulp1 family protease
MDTDDDKAATVIVTAVARPITGSIKDGQRDQPPAPPVETAVAIKERHHVSKTLALLSSPSYDKHTIIVSAFDTCITKADFARLQPDVMITDEVVNWMMRWWATQVNGRFGSDPIPPPYNPQMPRCYFASTLWYARMIQNGEFSYESVKRWTNKIDILSQYDLIFIPNWPSLRPECTSSLPSLT